MAIYVITSIVMGFIDIAIGTFPAAFGNPEWEFGVITAVLNGFAIPTMGLYLAIGSALARGRRGTARILAIVMIVLAVTVIGLGVLYALVAPIALTSVNQNPTLLIGVKKAILKSAIFVVAYAGLYAVAALHTFRRTRAAAV